MPRQKEPDFDCPVCGETVPGGSKSCPECGACEKSGWSDADQYGTSLPDAPEDFDYERFVEEEFGSGAKPKGIGKMWWWVALVLLVAMLWGRAELARLKQCGQQPLVLLPAAFRKVLHDDHSLVWMPRGKFARGG